MGSESLIPGAVVVCRSPTMGAMYEDDDTPRRTDPRTKLVAIVLILCLIAGAAPFLMSLIF